MADDRGRGGDNEWVAVEPKGPDPPTVAQVIAKGSKTIRDDLWKSSDGADLIRLFKELWAELEHRKVDSDRLAVVANEIKRQLPAECPTPADMRRMVFGIYEGGFAEPVPELLSPPVWNVSTIPTGGGYSPRSPAGSPPPLDLADNGDAAAGDNLLGLE